MFDLADLSTLLDTRFLTALPSALAGAGLGAWTAQWIAARNKKTDERLKEIRAASAAATIAYGITDDMLDMKHQVIKPVVDQFETDRERFIQADALPKPPGATTITFSVSMPFFRFHWSPAKDLQDIVFDDVSAPMRPMMVLPALTRALSTLDILAADRNEMIKHFQDIQKAGKQIDPHAFYGVPSPKGGVDKRFADTLQHISQFTDNTIIFSHLVGDDLRDYALALRQTLPKAMQPLAPRVTTADFSRRADVMPDKAKYQKYTDMHRPVACLAPALGEHRLKPSHWPSISIIRNSGCPSSSARRADRVTWRCGSFPSAPRPIPGSSTDG
jgi:hypothetical protein